MSLLAIAALAAFHAVAPAAGAAASEATEMHSAPLIPPATIDDSLEVVGESVGARRIRSRMSVAVRINGQGPFPFVVDSGADRSVIGSALARRLSLPAGPPVILQSIAGRASVGTVRIGRLGIGASEIRDIVAPTLAEANLGAHGLLGIDALADQRLLLDFDARTIVVQDSRRPQPAPARPDEIVVTARRRKGQLIITRARVGRERIYAVIDSGSEVTIGNSALYARLFRRRDAPAASPITLIGVTGQTVAASTIIVPEISIGGVALRNVTIAFADMPPVALFGLAEQPALLLGADVLEAFRRVSLDFRGRKVRFLLRGQ